MFIKMLKLCSLVLISFIIIIESGYTQGLEIKYNENTYIEEDKDSYYIGQLAGIDSDSRGNIYLFDNLLSRVIKLDPKLQKKKTIIKRGRGPGEINSIYSFYVNRVQDLILLADRQNRRLVVVDTEGESKESVIIHPNDMNTPMNINHYDGDKYAFLFSVSPMQSLRKNKNVDKLFHIFDINEKKRVTSFGERKTIFEKLNYGEGAANQTQIYIGDVVFIDKETMIYAPYVYNGEILKYTRSSGGTWAFHSKTKGQKYDNPPFTDIGYKEYQENREKYKSGKNIVTTVGLVGESAGYINYKVVGLHQLENKKVVNFIVVEKEVEESFHQELHVEVFGPDLKFLGSDLIYTGKKGEIIRDINYHAGKTFYMAIESGTYKARGIKFDLEFSGKS